MPMPTYVVTALVTAKAVLIFLALLTERPRPNCSLKAFPFEKKWLIVKAKSPASSVSVSGIETVMSSDLARLYAMETGLDC
jgi:hypothetical protein